MDGNRLFCHKRKKELTHEKKNLPKDPGSRDSRIILPR
jgi:hypothetical protein